MTATPVDAPTALPHHTQRARRGRWVGVPKRDDPRLPFAALMTLYAVTGTLLFGFNRSPLQMLVIVASGCLLDMFLHHVLRGRTLLFPLSAYISCVSLTLLLNYSHSIWITLFPVYLTIALKYVLTINGRHAYNPSLLGVVGSLLVAGTLITAAPAYQWGEWWYTSPFMLVAAVLLVVTKVNRSWLVFSFLLFYSLQTLLRAYFMRHHIPWDVMFVGTLTAPPFFLFTFFMITDPATSPNSRKGQVAIAAAITLVDLYYHTMWSVFTFFYAAATVATARFLWAHAKVLRAKGPRARAREVRRSVWPRALAVVALVGLTGGVAWAAVIHPAVRVTDAGFELEDVSATAGMNIQMDPGTLDLVDERVRHISKWLLSVGSGAFVDDVDSDGRVDVLLTSPLARPDDRLVLFRNASTGAGSVQFERTTVPQFASAAGDPKEVGLPAGALFVDIDDDGDRDLLVMAAFGQVRMLRNESTPGNVRYADITSASGIDEYVIGTSANAIDYDRDGDLDLLLGEILPNDLPGYGDDPERLNIFDLPLAEGDDDRRMLKFMHASWDDATNGGENVMYRNDGDSTFTRIRGRDLGMPETHYTISIGTGDLNRDGYTDLYLASDFGRDDLYVNEGGDGFRRIAGRFNGSIGKDTYKGMNSTIADLDRNGWPDVYVSNVHQELQAEGSLLWMNQGTKEGTDEHEPPRSAKRFPAPKLRDQATGRGALNEDRFGWGGEAVDLDNDGWLELAQANGMVGDRLDELADGARNDGCPDYWYVNHKLMQSGPEIHTYADKWGDLRGRCIYADEEQRIYKNRGADARPQFVDVAEVTGLTQRGEGRGTAVADFDDDGRMDMVVTMQHQPPVVLRTEPTRSSRDNGWLALRLVADGSSECNRDGIGSQVRVLEQGRRDQWHEVQLVNGFASQRDPRTHIGLGDGTPRDVSLEVRWCGGEQERFEVERDGYRELRQGEGDPVD